jgi:2-oxoglutarate ferredoxin oxidoreductase subunit alpha
MKLRTPVVLLTSKEMVMTARSCDLSTLPPLETASMEPFSGGESYVPYARNDGHLAPFLPVGNAHHQVRLNASTHDQWGLTRKATAEALDNTRLLQEKVVSGTPVHFGFEVRSGSDCVLVAYGVSAGAARQAARALQVAGEPVDLLVVQTLLPVARQVLDALQSYRNVFFIEENLVGAYRQLCYGAQVHPGVHAITGFGHMIAPDEIERKVRECRIRSSQM